MTRLVTASLAPEPLWPGFPPRALPLADPLGTHDPTRVVALAQAPAEFVPDSEVAALRRVLAGMSEAATPAAAVARALDLALEVTGCAIGSIWLVQPNGRLARAVHCGVSEQYLSVYADDPEWAASQARLCLAPDVRVFAELTDDCISQELRPLIAARTVAAIPLRARGRRAGALILAHGSEGWFTHFRIDFLRALGEVLATALDDARILAELDASADLHRGLLASAQDAIVCVGADGCFAECNPAFERLTGRPREQVIGAPYDAFTPADGVPALRAAVERLIATGEPIVAFRKDCLHVSGTRVPTVIHATRYTDSAGAVRIVAVLRDERARMQAEERARASHDQLALMLRHLDAGVVLLSADDLRIEEHNPAFARLVAPGWHESLAAQHLSDVLEGGIASELAAAIATARGERRAVTLGELRAPGAGAEPRWWSATVAPLPVPPGAPLARLMLTLADVSERRALEDGLRHAQKMQAVGTLAGGIAHEFNNLLTAILGNLSLALLDLPPQHPVVPGLRDGESAAQRAADLTRQLLGFSRRSPMRAAPSDLSEIVEDSLPLLERTFDPRIAIVREFARDLWRVRVDAAQMGQVIVNLCVNARDAMPEGGRLTLRLRNHRALAAGRGQVLDAVVLEVADTGAGMSPEVLARIYEPFFTTKGPDRGTGLGLSVVHGIVEQHGGWVECESQAGRGTTFRIVLPAMDAGEPGALAPMGQGETVLVVDDEAAIRGLARAVLERQGYLVELASDGVEALERLAGGLHVSLVVLDQTMPRLSGRQTLERLRAVAPEVPVLLTSGYAQDAASLDENGGRVGFLPKPYAPERLAQAVREALDPRA